MIFFVRRGRVGQAGSSRMDASGSPGGIPGWIATAWLVLILGLHGCAGGSGGPQPLLVAEGRVSVEMLWRQKIGDGQGKSGYQQLVPVVAGELIYVAAANGQVQAMDHSSGELRWERKLPVGITAGLSIHEGRLLLGSSEGEVVALASADGEPLWARAVEGEILAPPQTDGEMVVTQTLDGKILGLSMADGQRQWDYRSGLPLLTLRGTATPVVYEEQVYAGRADGSVIAVSLEEGILLGEQRLSVPMGTTELDRLQDVDSTPLVVGEFIYAVSYQGNLMRMALPELEQGWSVPASSFVDLAAGAGQLYLSDSDAVVRAMSIRDGRQNWELELPNGPLTAPVTVGSTMLAVADSMGYLYILSQADGRLLHRSQVLSRRGVRARPLADGERLYLYGNDGRLVALRLNLLPQS